MFDTYKPSGRFGSLCFPLLIGGMLVAVLLAFVYQLALYWIPFIYFSFIATIGMGVAMGAISSYAVNLGKVRNVSLAVLLGCLLAATGLSAKFYFQYRTMISEVVGELMLKAQAMEGFKEENRDEITRQMYEDVSQQVTFFQHLKFRIDQGWDIGRGGNQVNGIAVYLVWLIEAGVIFYYAVSAPKSAALAPFSEKVDQWASEEELVMTLPVTDQEMVSRIKAAASVDDLLSIPIPKSDESNQFAIYRVNSIEGRELDDAYLSVDLLTLSTNNKGEQETQTESLVKLAVLPSSKRAELMENASLMQEAFEAYRAALEAEAQELKDDEPENDEA